MFHFIAIDFNNKKELLQNSRYTLLVGEYDFIFRRYFVKSMYAAAPGAPFPAGWLLRNTPIA